MSIVFDTAPDAIWKKTLTIMGRQVSLYSIIQTIPGLIKYKPNFTPYNRILTLTLKMLEMDAKERFGGVEVMFRRVQLSLMAAAAPALMMPRHHP